MDNILIRGGRPLRGEIDISGAKNAALPLMAATFPLESAADAHRALEGDHIGNIVLKVS